MKRILIFIIIILILGGGFYAFRQYNLQQQSAAALANLQTEPAKMGDLTATIGATGVVRSNQSALITWQTSGTVDAVNFTVGQQVSADAVMATIKETSLSQNIILAKADLVAAQRQLKDLFDTQLQLAQALQAVEDAEQALEDLQNPELQQAIALENIANAEKAVDLAERRLQNLQSTASDADIDAAEAQVVLAKDALDKAEADFAPYENKPETNLTRAMFQSRLAAAQQQYDRAVRQFNGLQSTANAIDVSVAEADLATAEAQLVDTQRAWERLKDGPSSAKVALLETQLAEAKKTYEDIKEGPDPDDITAIEARIAASQATIELAALTAPFNGQLTRVAIKPGDQVNPGTAGFQIDDLSRLLVDVDISEVDINRVQVGQEVTLSFDAILDREYNGQIVEVGLVGSTLQGVVSFNVTVELLDADENVRPGMTAAVNIVVNRLENVLVVPNRAVRVRDGERVVYILKSGTPLPEPVMIELGASSEAYSEVVSGELQEGDAIVLNPPSDFSSFFGGGPPGGRQGGP